MKGDTVVFGERHGSLGVELAYTATVLPVMIASPNDTSEERRIIRETINEWNVINSKSTHCVLLPRESETHSAPGFSGRPQEQINEFVLSDCDLLVAVFSNRLGTPTGKAESGTVEEIKVHAGKNKPTMIYFSSAPIPREKIDTDQYRALEKFKDWCSSQSIFESYGEIYDLEKKFRRQLEIKIQTDHYLKNLVTSFHGVHTILREETWSEHLSVRLSEEATRLLIEASRDKNGTIMFVRNYSGTIIQTNNTNFTAEADARTLARWEAAVEQLVKYGLVDEKGYRGEVFQVTAQGFEHVDRLNQSA